MKVSLEIDLGIKEGINAIKHWYKKQVCKRKGHVWVKYNDFYWSSMIDIYMGKGEPIQECSRCGIYKYDNKNKVVNKKVKIKQLGKLSFIDQTLEELRKTPYEKWNS